MYLPVLSLLIYKADKLLETNLCKQYSHGEIVVIELSNGLLVIKGDRGIESYRMFNYWVRGVRTHKTHSFVE